MILVCGGVKGGSGKTTLATNLTVMRSLSGKKVLLVDADEQRSASDWVNQRKASNAKLPWSTVILEGIYIFKEIERFAKDFDDIIVDVGGRDVTSQRSALSVADVFLTPFKPRSLDIWTLGSVRKMIQEVKTTNPKLKCYSVINQGDSRGADNEGAIKILNEFPDLFSFTTIIGHRKCFSNAAAEGLGIHELPVMDKKALKELKDLYDKIYVK